MTKVSWQIPLKTVSESNVREHWHKRAQRHTLQQMIVRSLFVKVLEPIPLPCTVKMIRLSNKRIDSDNLQMAFKWVRDQLGECLIPEERKFYIDKKGKTRELKGRCDDNPMIKWEYDQEKSKEIGIRIEISYE